MIRHFVLAILFVLLCNNTCGAQTTDSTKITHALMKCWRAISHEYSTIYGLEEEEIKLYSKKRICLSADSISMYYGVSYAPTYSIRKVNAENYAKNNFDCSKKKIGISMDSVFEVTISSIARSSKNQKEHKMTDVIAFDGDCIYVVADGVIFRLFDADAKIIPRASN